MTLDPESASLLAQAQQEARKRAGEVAVKATATDQRADAEVSVQVTDTAASGPSWAAKAWAKLTTRRDTRPEWSAGAEGSVRWLMAPRGRWWRRLWR